MISSRLTLREYFARLYCLDRALSAGTEYQYDRSIRVLDAWHGTPVELAELNDGMVSRWVRYLGEQYKPRTARNKRHDVVLVWRHAAKAGYCDPPGEVRKVRVPRPNPQAWNLEDVQALLSAADEITGYFGNGIKRAIYLRTLLEVAYQTGLRRGDLLRVSVDDIGQDGIISTVQNKTLDGHVCQITEETRARLLAISRRLKEDQDPHWRRPLRWPHELRGLYYWTEKLCSAAGVQEGSLQQLRRTGATYVEQQQPGAAQRYLGHKTPGLAYKSYVDRRKLNLAVSPPGVS